jgi:hypothetical protein
MRSLPAHNCRGDRSASRLSAMRRFRMRSVGDWLGVSLDVSCAAAAEQCLRVLYLVGLVEDGDDGVEGWPAEMAGQAS